MIDSLILQSSSTHPGLILVIYTVLVSFLLSTMIGFTYIKTFKGLSYSRNYVQAVMLASIVSAMVMQAIGDSLARGLGMMGALAIIRFRTNFKDSKDILFMFASVAAGISCGVGAYTIAVVGSIGFVVTSFLLHHTPLGQTSYFDGILRFNIENNDQNKIMLDQILSTYCKHFALITLRDMKQGERLDYAYHVKLKKQTYNTDLVQSLPEKIPSVKGVNLMMQEATVEM